MEIEKNVPLLNVQSVRYALMAEGAFTILHRNNQQGFGEVERFIILSHQKAHVLLSYRANQAPDLDAEEEQAIFPNQRYRRTNEWMEYAPPLPIPPDRINITLIDEAIPISGGLSCNICHDGISRLGGFYSNHLISGTTHSDGSFTGLLGYATTSSGNETIETIQDQINRIIKGSNNFKLMNQLEDRYIAKGSIPIVSDRLHSKEHTIQTIQECIMSPRYMQYIDMGIRRAILAR